MQYCSAILRLNPALCVIKKNTMIKIGKTNTLTVKSIQGQTLQLDGGSAGSILLKKEEAAHTCSPGDLLKVFIYVDREQQLLATTRTPLAQVGDFARLRVVSTTASGAYLDWGLENDLLVPKSEMQNPMREGRSYFVHVFVSTMTNRVTASSRLDKYISLQFPDYAPGEEVDLIIFDQTELGFRAIVNQSHEGMLYHNELYQHVAIGQELTGFIKKIRDDLKIDLRLQRPGHQRIDDISQMILQTVKDNNGCLPLTDKSPPKAIYAQFGISKKIFKKAIGTLYKQRLIALTPKGINLTSDQSPE
jgi:predicted RNA-binding protein (virulence factor B family)